MSSNETKLQEFLGTMVRELGAAANSVLVMMGDKLGLYKAIAQAGPLTSAQLAQRTGTAERYVREWLAAHPPLPLQGRGRQAGISNTTHRPRTFP